MDLITLLDKNQIKIITENKSYYNNHKKCVYTYTCYYISNVFLLALLILKYIYYQFVNFTQLLSMKVTFSFTEIIFNVISLISSSSILIY